jgi:MFS family permease
VAEATASLMKLAGGWISDRRKRRKGLTVGGYALAGITRPFLVVVTAGWQVLAIRFTDRVGKGIRGAPRDALLADSVPASRRGTAFGLHRAADHLGAVLGPLLATGILLLAPGRIRLVFLIASVPAILAVVFLALLVREVPPVPATAPSSASPERILGIRDLDPVLWRYLGVLALFTLGNATDAFLLLRAQGLGVPAAALPLLWGFFHVSKMTWNVPGGILSDRWHPGGAIVAGWLVYAGVYGGFAAASEAWHVWALFGIYGLFYGLTESPEKVLVASMAPGPVRARAFGVMHFTVGLTALPASVLFGLIWQGYGPGAAFLFGGVLALLSALLLPFALRGYVRRKD